MFLEWRWLQNPDTFSPPLVCNLNGVLLKTNLHAERRVQAVKDKIESLLSSSFEHEHALPAATKPDLEGTALPLNQALLDYLREQKATGRRLVLNTTESPEAAAQLLGEDQIFDEILSCRDTAQLNSTFGENSYDYIGDETTALDVWHSARQRIIVAPNNSTAADLDAKGLKVSKQFTKPGIDFKSAFRCLRAYQWLKNLLVFVPIITSQQLNDAMALKNSVIMFICFSMVASFGYIVNDLLDLKSDRAHPKKQHRPFASGNLSIRHGLIISMALLTITVLLSLALPAGAALALLAYLLLTIFYSLYLKTKLMIDVVALGSLFTLRVIGGAAAIESELSFYLLSFSIFIFSSLGMVKRFAELHNLQSRNQLVARGRGYRVEDMAPVRIIGISLGYMSVFIMGLYINSPLVTQYYSHPKFIWFLFPLLTYWLGRLWILANRGEVNEDPLIFAIKDRTSLMVVAVAALILIVAN